MINKIIKLFKKNWDSDVFSILKYNDEYWVRADYESSLLVCYKIFDDEPVEDGFTTINDELGMKIMNKGEIVEF